MNPELFIVSAVIQDEETRAEIFDRVKPEYFFDPGLRALYSEAYQLYIAGGQIDVFTVTAKHRGAYEYDTLINPYICGLPIEGAISLICDRSARARLRLKLTECQKVASDEETPLDEIKSKVSSSLFTALAETKQEKDRIIADEVITLYETRKQERRSGKALPGIGTGFTALDRATGGLQPGSLTIIGGRSAHGKSTLALDLFYRAGIAGTPALYVSLEQPSTDIFLYLIQKGWGLSPLKIKSGDLSAIEETNLRAHIEALRSNPLYFEDSCCTLSEILLRLRSAVLRHGIKLVVVDYLQLVENPLKGEPRHLQVAGVSRALKRAAMDLCISVVALSQLNKSPDERGGRARLSDVRESESITHDADHVLFINRPSLYDPGSDEPDFIALEKNRHGARIEKIPVYWNNERNSYLERI